MPLTFTPRLSGGGRNTQPAKNIGIRIDNARHAIIVRLAKALRLSMSDVLRLAIETAYHESPAGTTARRLNGEKAEAAWKATRWTKEAKGGIDGQQYFNVRLRPEEKDHLVALAASLGTSSKRAAWYAIDHLAATDPRCTPVLDNDTGRRLLGKRKPLTG